MKSCSTRSRPETIQAGFTLIELIVVVAMVAIIAALATPSWNTMIVNNRIRAAVNDWTQSFYFARNEAIRQNVAVTICASSTGLDCTASGYELGWIVKTGLPAATTGTILQDTLPVNRATLTPNINAARAITFLPNGLPIGNFAGAHLVVRDFPAADNSLSKYICIARTGRLRVYTNDQFLNLTTTCGA